ncbi:MAG TPA: GNAT family N-acetyltransferase [Dongiaceae bacterium]|nr:GNAT family N-acetyltransferase [Dongiaceae bacterium]
MDDRLHIRQAQEVDLPALQELYRHLTGKHDRCSPDEAIGILRKFLLYPGSAILVGTVGDELVTSCTLVVIPNLTRGGRPYALIENMVTHADWRKRGFGTAVLKVATERAWNEGCYKVMLMTGSKNPGTLAFYEAAGFEQTKTGFQIRRYPPCS